MRAVDTYMKGMITRGYASPARHPDGDEDYANRYTRRRNEVARPLSSVIGKRAKRYYAPLYTNPERTNPVFLELEKRREALAARTRAEREEDVRAFHRKLAEEREKTRLANEAREKEAEKRYELYSFERKPKEGYCIVCLGPIHDGVCVRPSYACSGFNW